MCKNRSIRIITITALLTVFLSCERDENEIIKFVSCGVLEDSRNGKEYKTVVIGNYCWMAENLNIGIMIKGEYNQTDNDTIEKYCYNNDLKNCDKYGGLYQWNEMMKYSSKQNSQGICPDGWYIPSDDEWKKMEIALGMSKSDANKDNAWRGQNIGTDLKKGGKTGFNALFAGARTSYGNWINIDNTKNEFAYFYSSSEVEGNINKVWRRCLSSNYPSIGRFDTFSKNYGFSVRCIKKLTN